jgi:putative endonuclease
MFYLYIIYSSSSDIFYVGHSDDPFRRLVEHNTSYQNTFTSKHRPWQLMAIYQCSENRCQALTVEKFIKKQKNRNLIRKLIEGEKFTGKLGQLVRVPHVRD